MCALIYVCVSELEFCADFRLLFYVFNDGLSRIIMAERQHGV
jgi:hypothetical protein